MKKSLPLIITSVAALFTWSLFVYSWIVIENIPEPLKILKIESRALLAVDRFGNNRYIAEEFPSILPHITHGVAKITAESPKIFAYAHGTVIVGDKMFIGMADKLGNPFSTSVINVFDGSNINYPAIITLPITGDIETMVHDSLNDKIYFLFSNSKDLKILSLNPKNYTMALVVSSSTLEVGRKPAITTDGKYIYGITDTEPSKVFRVEVNGQNLVVNMSEHIDHGHAAAIGVYASSTELYFSGGMSNGIEKVDAITLDPISSVKVEPCNMSDDMPYEKMATSSGYIYIGCESVDYGIRLKTDDMTYERFSLPGSSFGLYIYGNDLYNAGRDGTLDVFPGKNLKELRRYRVLKGEEPFMDETGQDVALNEIFYSPQLNKIYFTAWWGTKGLYEVSTSTTI